MDAVQAAKSGHPGTPMAMAPVAFTLWHYALRYDPMAPNWPNRDRFILSIGHASALLYSLLHLTRVRSLSHPNSLAVPLEDLKRFRQLDSLCPGHPEYGFTSGVETTSGPLGQGVANSVGMAIAARWQAATFNRPGFEVVKHDVYALTGDGCMMEGVSSEAASLAGHLKLANLCWIYDSNSITIEGSTSLAFTEDVGLRFEAYGWQVLHVSDANDCAAIETALDTFRQTTDRPTLIIVQSVIGFGSPGKQGSHTAHGEPLGEDEVRLTKRAYGWPEDAQFLVPEEVTNYLEDTFAARGSALHAEWQDLFERYSNQYPDLANQFLQMQARELPDGWEAVLPEFPADPAGLAGRDASGKVLNALSQSIPWLIGGSADLAPSTKTRLTYDGAGDFSAGSPEGKNFHFGVREHAMGAILNGMALSNLRPFGSQFLIFSDYSRPTFRLSSLMELPVLSIYTHDSIGVGEDGPTHQPIEQIASLRAIPGLHVFRPGDANEVAESYRAILKLSHAPSALVLSRQAMPTFDRTHMAPASEVSRGAYVLIKEDGAQPDLILMASGTELSLCVQAHAQLNALGVSCRVVSMPSWSVFEGQSEEYKHSVLPPSVSARIAVEMASPFGWERYTGLNGRILGISSFGASAPLKHLLPRFGFTPDAIVSAAKELLV